MTIRRPSFIVFEGLDGSGKSTCAAQLAEYIGAELMTTPSPRVRRYRDDLVDSLGSSQDAKQLFYLATVFAASDEVSVLLRRGRSVVLDRYFLSTQAYASFRGSRLALDAVQRLLQPADTTFYMDTPIAARIARLHRRGASAADLESITTDADHRLLHEHLRRAHLDVVGRFVRVPGWPGSEREVLERVVAELTLADEPDELAADDSIAMHASRKGCTSAVTASGSATSSGRGSMPSARRKGSGPSSTRPEPARDRAGAQAASHCEARSGLRSPGDRASRSQECRLWPQTPG